ncbi:MAG: helix-turn-helix protein [Paenibacillaceae bacterium]|nr:helix-turn-helix protein [Paenibacillaceae bacterium]
MEQQSIWLYQRSFTNQTISQKPHVSHRFKAVWIRKGCGFWNIAGDVCAIKPDDLVLLNNEEERVIEQITSDENLDFFIMEFEPRLLFDSGLLPLFTEQVNGYAHRIVAADRAMLHILERIREEYASRDGFTHLILVSCVMQLLALFARRTDFAPGGRPRVNPLMKQVLAYIDGHYTRRITLEELAGIAHMSSTAFSRYFTKYNGIGPAQYIKRKRIAQAIRLLEETDRTILDIAMDCGFQNISNFYKAFHSLTRQAPGDYRNDRVDS